jgi:hypothetical protein
MMSVLCTVIAGNIRRAMGEQHARQQDCRVLVVVNKRNKGRVFHKFVQFCTPPFRGMRNNAEEETQACPLAGGQDRR